MAILPRNETINKPREKTKEELKKELNIIALDLERAAHDGDNDRLQRTLHGYLVQKSDNNLESFRQRMNLVKDLQRGIDARSGLTAIEMKSIDTAAKAVENEFITQRYEKGGIVEDADTFLHAASPDIVNRNVSQNWKRIGALALVSGAGLWAAKKVYNAADWVAGAIRLKWIWRHTFGKQVEAAKQVAGTGGGLLWGATKKLGLAGLGVWISRKLGLGEKIASLGTSLGLDKYFGFFKTAQELKKKAEDAIAGVTGKVTDTISSVTSGVEKLQKELKDAQDAVKGLKGEAKEKVQKRIEQAKVALAGAEAKAEELKETVKGKAGAAKGKAGALIDKTKRKLKGEKDQKISDENEETEDDAKEAPKGKALNAPEIASDVLRSMIAPQLLRLHGDFADQDQYVPESLRINDVYAQDIQDIFKDLLSKRHTIGEIRTFLEQGITPECAEKLAKDWKLLDGVSNAERKQKIIAVSHFFLRLTEHYLPKIKKAYELTSQTSGNRKDGMLDDMSIEAALQLIVQQGASVESAFAENIEGLLGASAFIPGQSTKIIETGLQKTFASINDRFGAIVHGEITDCLQSLSTAERKEVRLPVLERMIFETQGSSYTSLQNGKFMNGRVRMGADDISMNVAERKIFTEMLQQIEKNIFGADNPLILKACGDDESTRDAFLKLKEELKFGDALQLFFAYRKQNVMALKIKILHIFSLHDKVTFGYASTEFAGSLIGSSGQALVSWLTGESINIPPEAIILLRMMERKLKHEGKSSLETLWGIATSKIGVGAAATVGGTIAALNINRPSAIWGRRILGVGQDPFAIMESRLRTLGGAGGPKNWRNWASLFSSRISNAKGTANVTATNVINEIQSGLDALRRDAAFKKQYKQVDKVFREFFRNGDFSENACGKLRTNIEGRKLPSRVQESFSKAIQAAQDNAKVLWSARNKILSRLWNASPVSEAAELADDTVASGNTKVTTEKTKIPDTESSPKTKGPTTPNDVADGLVKEVPAVRTPSNAAKEVENAADDETYRLSKDSPSLKPSDSSGPAKGTTNGAPAEAGNVKTNVDTPSAKSVATVQPAKAADAVQDATKTSQAASTVSTAAETGEQAATAGKANAAATTGEAVVDGANAVGKAATAGEALAKPAEALGKFDSLYEEVRNARAAKDNRKILELLKRSADLIKSEAAAGNRVARSMLLVLRFATAARWAGRALMILGPLIDAALLIVNRFDISAAREANNEEMVRTLESKEKALAGQAGVGLTLLALGPVGLAAAPVAIASSIVTNNIYSSIVQWETSSRQWLNEDTEILKKKYEELEIGYMDAGHKYGILTHPFARPFANRGKTSAQVDSEEFRQVESVNEHVRQEILTAYFLKTMKLPVIPNETQEQYKDRALTGVRDRLAFVKTSTDGSYARGILPDERFFGGADEYANIASLQRNLDSNNKERVLSYEWNGTIQQLDLKTLDYIRTPKTGNAVKDHQRSMAYLKTMKQYREQVAVYGDAILEMQAMAPSIVETKKNNEPVRNNPNASRKIKEQAA